MNRHIKLKKYKAGVMLTSAAVLASVFLFSFTVKSFTGDFLKQLGITKKDADERIVSTILSGSFNEYGLRNAKNIATGNRAAIVKDVLEYSKNYIGSSAFSKAYNEMKQNQKPQLLHLQTPEEMQKELIERSKKSVAEMEASTQKADASLKPMFEKMVADAKKQLKEAEDPDNKMIATYRKNYPQAMKDAQTGNEKLLADWEARYPSNHLLFVKKRMQEFLEETKDIDFSAQLVEKNGKKYFVNKEYESKSNRWKMGFRAGKEAVEAARIYVQQWMKEIQ
jgi:vacuolar-type H+-ATPase subunit H